VRNVHKIFVREPEQQRPSAGLGYNWEDNIKVHVQEEDVGVCGLNFSGSG
jgi:hypothetical protein